LLQVGKLPAGLHLAFRPFCSWKFGQARVMFQQRQPDASNCASCRTALTGGHAGRPGKGIHIAGSADFRKDMLMRISLTVSAFALCLALSLPAQAWHPNEGKVKIDAGINVRFNVYMQDQLSQAPLAPWYLYWPAEAVNYQSSSPLGGLSFPNWPSSWPTSANKNVAPGNNDPTPNDVKMPHIAQSTPPVPHASPWAAKAVSSGSSSAFQPVGYFTQAPSYWYGQ
jgi:hypothetical protein